MAKRGINKAIVMGNLGQDPEVRYAQDGTAFATLSIATSETWKDKQSGEQRENTEWHRVSIIGKLAEIAGEYLRKGSKVYIEGKLQTRKWQGQDGKDNYTTEIVVNQFNGEMQMLGDGNNSGGNSNRPPQPPANDPGQNSQGSFAGNTQSSAPNPQPLNPNSDFDDDIPFAPIAKQCRSLLNAL